MHRLNQTVDVLVYKLIVHDTVEARILELQEAKRKLASAAIEGAKGANKLSMKDIMKLFRREAELEHRDEVSGLAKERERARDRERERDRVRDVGMKNKRVWRNLEEERRELLGETSGMDGRGSGGGGKEYRPGRASEDAVYGRR